MSVRRLAPDSVQPREFDFSPANKAWAERQIARYPKGRQASAVIPLLWQAQKQGGGWVSRAAIERIAALLDMPRIRVLEVATFYTMFNLEPVGRHHVQLCGTTPCALRGAEALKKVCAERIGPSGAVTADGKLSWIEVECLGACCNAPMVQINDDFYEDLTPESFRKLLDDLAEGRPVTIGSQTGRRGSEPEGAVTTLADASLYDGSRIGAWRQRFEERPAPPAASTPPATPATAAPTAAAPATVPAAPPVDAPVTPEAARLAEAERAEVEARLAALPRGASALDKANAVGTRPAGEAQPAPGKSDDLKRIRGIGRVNEGRLNELGIYFFRQVAAWSRNEIRWVGTYLAFPGRIDREQWVEQARTLAAGGETSFSRRVDRGEVPTSSGGKA